MFWDNKEKKIERLRDCQNALLRNQERTKEVALEYAQTTEDYNVNRDYFKKSSHSQILARSVEEKYQRFQKAYSKEIRSLEKEQKSLLREIDSIIKSQDLEILNLYSAYMPAKKWEQLAIVLTKGHKQGLVDTDQLKELLSYRKVDLKKASVYVKDNRTNYADLILINSKNEILFLIRSKNDSFEPGKYCLPGGHVEPNENPQAAAVRETEEETGIKIDIDMVTPCGNYIDNKTNIHYFTTKYDGEPIVLEEREQWNFEWVPIEKVGTKPLLMNLRENLEKVIEIPISNLNPEASVGGLFYHGGCLMKSEEHTKIQKAVDTICNGYNEGLLDREALRDALNKVPQEKQVYSIVKGDKVQYHAKVIPTKDVIEKAKYLKKKPDGKGGWIYEYEMPKGDKEKKEEIQPIGKGKYGPVYDQFKGRPKEAVKFLSEKKTGRAVGVFTRKDSRGQDFDIDLVWGDKTYGLAHIVDKHIVKMDDFDSLTEMIDIVQEIVNDAKFPVENNREYLVYKKPPYKVAIKKEKDADGKETFYILSSYDHGRSPDEKLRKAQEELELLEKANVAQVGEVREWGGSKYKKTPNGWEPYTEPKTKVDDETPPNESKLTEEELSEYARSATEEQLQQAATGPDERLRVAAKREIARREKEENFSEQEDKPGDTKSGESGDSKEPEGDGKQLEKYFKKFQGVKRFFDKNKFKKDSPLSLEEQAVLYSYTTPDYAVLNNELRTGKADELSKAMAYDLDQALSKLSNKKGTVYRGMEFYDEWELTAFYGELTSQQRNNGYVEFKTPTSTSTKKSEMNFFATLTGNGSFGVQMEIKSKTGKPVSEFSDAKGESEVLFRTSTKFKVKSVEKVDNQLKVKLEEI